MDDIITMVNIEWASSWLDLWSTDGDQWKQQWWPMVSCFRNDHHGDITTKQSLGISTKNLHVNKPSSRPQNGGVMAGQLDSCCGDQGSWAVKVNRHMRSEKMWYPEESHRYVVSQTVTQTNFGTLCYYWQSCVLGYRCLSTERNKSGTCFLAKKR